MSDIDLYNMQRILCSKTITGKHRWVNSYKTYSSIQEEKVIPLTQPQCELCGMIDDREEVKTNDKT